MILAYPVFLSTPPSRVATHRYIFRLSAYHVSIHATLAGGDQSLTFGTVRVRVSIHATLAGGDSSSSNDTGLSGVSIHATLAGGDARITGATLAQDMFLSTPPSRVATCCRRCSTIALACFYPRHPRGWRLRLRLSSSFPHLKFLSTPPSRVATGFYLIWRTAFSMFLSTPPSRVATAINAHGQITQGKFLSTPPSRVATKYRRLTEQTG